jgi:hypothetical protein
MADGTSVYSIYRAARKTELSYYHKPLYSKALHNALINKDNVRYMKVDDECYYCN